MLKHLLMSRCIYPIYENITGWYAAYTCDHPKTVNVDRDKSVEILFTKEAPEHDEPFSIWLPGVAVIGLILFVGLVYFGGGPQIVKQVMPIFSNPYFWLFLALLVISIVVWLIYQDITSRIDAFAAAVNGIKII
jgi:hypothetical protein